MITRFKSLATTPMGKRLVNIGHMLTGNFANGAVMLLAVALVARALGPTVFGSMVLVLALASTVERLIRFESWQPLIKFAADEEQQSHPTRMARLYAFGLLLDAGTAAAAAAITIAGAALAEALGFRSIPVAAAAIYAIAMLCNITGAPGAALRLDGRFMTVAYTQVPANLVRAALAGLGLWLDAGLLYFMAVWTVAEASYRLALLWLGSRSLARQGIPNPLTVSWRGLHRDFPGFMSFAWSINFATMLRTLTHQADELVVGALAGPAAASMYNLAKRIAKFGQELGTQVQTVLYPDLARMWSGRYAAQFRSTILKTQAALSAVGVCIIIGAWLLGEWVLRIGPGASYLPAYPLLLIQVVAVLFTMHAAPARSALLSMGRHRAVLAIAALSTVIFYAAMVPGVLTFGPAGAAVAHVLLAVVTAALMDLIWLRQSRPSGQPDSAGLPAGQS